MSDWSNPLSTALGTLVRKALQSVGFVSGSTGWQIQRSGNAEFNQAIFRGNVFVTTASNPGGSVQVVRNPIPQNDLIAFYAPTVISSAIILFDNGSSSYSYWANLEDGTTAIGAVNSGSVVVELFRFFPPAAGIAKLLSNNIDRDINGMAEVWHGLAYQNLWADNGGTNVTGQYRLVPSPARTVQIIGTLNAGTKADNTVVANLPAGYRPAKTISFPVGMFPPNLGGNSMPMFQLLANGDLLCQGCVNATFVWMNALIPLDA